MTCSLHNIGCFRDLRIRLACLSRPGEQEREPARRAALERLQAEYEGALILLRSEIEDELRLLRRQRVPEGG